MSLKRHSPCLSNLKQWALGILRLSDIQTPPRNSAGSVQPFPSHFYRVFNLFKLDLCWQWIPLFLILMSFRHHSPVPNSSWWFQANLLRTRFINFIFPFLNTDRHWVICVELAEITRCIFASEKHAGGAKWRGGTSMRCNECGFIGSLPQSVDSQSYAWLCRWSSQRFPLFILGCWELAKYFDWPSLRS